MHTLPNVPASVTRESFARLCRALEPLPVPTPEDRASREDAAMAAVAALHPSDAFEAGLAVDIVALEVYATDSLRLAGLACGDLKATLQCRAHAAAMFRQVRSLLRDYRATQAQRDAALARMHPAAMERAGYWFREAAAPEPPPPAPDPAPPETAAAAEPPQQTRAFEDLTEVEQYAVLYPDRAARIRAERGLPARATFPPPEPDIVDGLVNGTSSILLALDAPPLARAA